MYYAATVVFIVLDYFLDINVRLAFLEQAPIWRGTYYAFILLCLGLMVRWPQWTTLIGTIESVLILAFLIIHMGIRVMLPSGPAVTISELINFVLSGAAAYIAYWRGMAQLGREKNGV